MNRITTLVSATVTSAALVATLAAPAFAWHPVGVITKKVQNVSQNSPLADADSASKAIHAKPGDTLKYVIIVENKGQKHSKGWNDMYFTQVKDQLPAGITLVDGQTNKELGHIAAGASKSYEFTVKVQAQQDGAVICNTAAFTGDSEVKDQPQAGQDKACIKVAVPVVPTTPEVPVTPELPEEPETPVTPVTPVVPEEPKVEETPVTPVEVPAELPKTGLSSTFAGIVGASALVTAGLSFIRTRR